MPRLTLHMALQQGRLSEFIVQADAESINTASHAQFEDLMSRVFMTEIDDQQATDRNPGTFGSWLFD
jgi:hypothetical protein